MGKSSGAKLAVVICEITNFKLCDNNVSSDPYCKVAVGNGKPYETAIKKKLSRHCVWNEYHEFSVGDARSLHVGVFDKDSFSSDDFMGKLEIPLAHFADQKPHDEWYRLQDGEGEIHLICTLEDPSTPPFQAQHFPTVPNPIGTAAVQYGTSVTSQRPSASQPQPQQQQQAYAAPPQQHSVVPPPPPPVYSQPQYHQQPQPQYVAPAPQPYAPPPPQYSAPPPYAAAPQYSAPPQYGAPPPQYGAPPPQYGAPPPQYSAPQYGAPYGAPPPQYGAPPPQYGAPPPQYGAPPPQYGAPPPQYGAPPPQYPPNYRPY